MGCLPVPSFDGPSDRDRSGEDIHGRPSAGAVIAVHTCSRIGMQANPPRTSFISWLRRR